jgi:hypothetical protein
MKGAVIMPQHRQSNDSFEFSVAAKNKKAGRGARGHFFTSRMKDSVHVAEFVQLRRSAR